MSGYTEAGYVIVLGSLAGYAMSLLIRERASRRQLRAVPTVSAPDPPVPAANAPRSRATKLAGRERP